MIQPNNKIYPFFIKQKIISFIIFFAIAALVFLLSLFYSYLPPIFSFILVCIPILLRNYSNFLLSAYFFRVSKLKEEYYPQESTGFIFFIFLSIPIIIITGLFMNLLLYNPNYNAGYVQLFLLFSLFIIINEFLSIYKFSISFSILKPISKKPSFLKNQSGIVFLVSLIIENIFIFYTLFIVALALKWPNNLLGVIFLIFIVFLLIFYYLKFSKKFKED